MAIRFKRIDLAMQNAARSAVNKLTRKVNTQAGKQVRKIYNIKARDLKRYIKIKRATNANPVAEFRVIGKRLPLYLFSPRQTRRGVTIRVRKDGGRKRLKRGFIASVNLGRKTSIFERITSRRLPIKIMFTVSPGEMYDKEGKRTVDRVIRADAGKEFKNELAFFMSRLR